MSLISTAQAEKLRRIAAAGGALSGGRLQFVGLDAVRAHFADSWEQKRDLILRHARNAIESVLAEHDVFLQIGDQGFFMVFADPDPVYAEARCMKAEAEIKRRLLGEDALLAEMVSPESQTLSFSDDELAEVLAQSIAGKDSSKLLKNLGGEGREVGRDRAAPAAGTASKGGEGTWEAPASAAVRTLFRPLWDLRRKVLVKHLAVPVVKGRAGPAIPGYGQAETAADRHVALDMDVAVLGATLASLESLPEAERPPLVSVSIQASSFSNPSLRNEMLATLHEAPKALRERLVFVIHEARLGVAARDLDAAVGSLAANCRGLAFMARLSEDHLDRLAARNLRLAGLDLGAERPLPPELLKERLAAFAAQARSLKMRAFLVGVEERALAEQAMVAGFSLVGGDGLGPAVEALPAAAPKARPAVANEAAPLSRAGR